MTQLPLPTNAALAAIFHTHLAFPPIAFGRPVSATTMTLTFGTCHDEAKPTESMYVGSIDFSQNGYIMAANTN